MSTKAKNIKYRWPDLSNVIRRYVVLDDKGRYGIAYSSEQSTLWARPIGKVAEMSASPETALPQNAVIMTSTSWTLQEDGTYKGIWFDYSGPSFPANIPEEKVRYLTIIDDLGYQMPDKWADIALSGSDEMGYWDRGATLGKIGGEPRVK
jgi:hypothetical protein